MMALDSGPWFQSSARFAAMSRQRSPPICGAPNLAIAGTSVLLSLQIASCSHGQIDWIGSRAGQLVKIRDLELFGWDPWSHESHEMRHEMG